MTDTVNRTDAEAQRSVIFRTGKITQADYAEAIEALKDAARQGECAGMCCSVCEDTGHTAEACHHNPLVAARAWVAATSIYVCYHCGFTATNDEEAKDHFGHSDSDPARCLTSGTPMPKVEASLDERMKAVGMIPLSKLLSGDTPLSKWGAHAGVQDLDTFEQWLFRRHEEFLRMRVAYELGDRDKADELYEWVLAHAGAYSEVAANFRKVTTPRGAALTLVEIARECIEDRRHLWPEDPPRWADCGCAGCQTEKLADAVLAYDAADGRGTGRDKEA